MGNDQDEFRDRDYPIQEYMLVQRRHWVMERIGWVMFSLIILAAVLGLFSQGVLSLTNAQSPDGAVIVEYQRFERNSAASQVYIQLRGEPDQELQLEITGDFLDRFSIEGIQPEPLRSDSYHEGLRLTLRADSDGEVAVHLTMRAAALGSSSSSFGLAGSAPVTIDQFIFP